ncbi:MAG TPA: PH domain-containing protein [Acidimicrobiales bacterium]|nr:PH domain-containing protein [Acidimicrobiales bacterium]
MAPGGTDLRAPRRTSPLGALVDVVSVDGLRNAVPALVVAVSFGRVALVLAIGLVVAVASSVIAWSRRLWSFDGDVLHLDEGVFVRNQRRIPVERIQHVELERRLRHQLLGLAAVRVETAGGSGAELRLDAVTLAEAEALRAVLLRARDAADPAVPDAWDVERHGPVPPPPAPPSEVLVRLPPSRLLLSGITGPEVAAVLAALAFGIDALVDLGIDPEEVAVDDIGRSSVVALVAVAIPAWLAVAGLVGLVRRWDLTASVRGDELRVTYGLLQRHELVLRTDRVQDARVSERLLLRPFGRADLRVRSAASGKGDASRVDIPLLAADEVDRVLARVLPAAVPRPVLATAPSAARRRALARGAVAGVALGGAVVVLAWATAWSLLVLVALVVPAGVGLGELSYRGLGWAEARGVHHSRVGALGRHTAVVPSARVQSAAVVASWFQRRRGLATTRLDLAGDAVGVVDRELRECRAIAARVTTA